jgi:TetR/AcrR family transcriptional repressor of mexCD-oprJ operon
MPRSGARSPRRADAERNIARILEAARGCLGRDPDAAVEEIARAAGVGRVTLYGHFPSRSDLVEAALVHALDEGDKVLAAVDLAGNPRLALTRLIESSWALTADSMSLLTAAQKVLTPGRIRDLHAHHVQRAEDLARRGQQEQVFRSDLPASWLVSVLHGVMKGAVDEIRAGRLESGRAAHVITATIQAAWGECAR